MAKKLKTGWIVEEQVVGIDRWFRTNGWIYENEGKALDLGERRADHPDVSAVRILEIHHTEPVVKHEIS